MLRGLHPTDAISVRKVEFIGHGSGGGDHIPPSVRSSVFLCHLPTHGHRRLPSAVSLPVRPLHAFPPHIVTAIVNCYYISPSPCRMLAIACEWKYFSPASHPRSSQHIHDVALPAPSTPYCPPLSVLPPCLRHLHLLVPLGTSLHSHLVLVACEGTLPRVSPSCHTFLFPFPC